MLFLKLNHLISGVIFFLSDGSFSNQSLALMDAASFFVIAMTEQFKRWLHFACNCKKDIADSSVPAPKNHEEVEGFRTEEYLF